MSLLDEIAAELAAAASAPRDELQAQISGALKRLKGAPVSVAETPRKIQLLLEAGTLFYADGGDSIRLALEPIAEAELLAEDSGDTKQLRRSLSVKGLVLSQLGDPGGALVAFEEALQLAEELDESYGKAAAWTNMGILLSEAGLLAEADACVRMTISIALTLDEHSFHGEILSSALHTSAICKLYCGEPSASLQLCDKAISALPEDTAVIGALSTVANQRRALLEALAAQCLIDLNRLKDAKVRVGIAIEAAHAAGAERALVGAECVSCLVDAASGDSPSAITRLDALRPRAGSALGQYLDYLRICIKAYELAGRSTEALRCYRELMTVLRRGQSDAIRHKTGRTAAAVESADNDDSHESKLTKLAERVRDLLARNRFSVAKL